MTGFGKSQVELKGRIITVEIRSLNSKQLDLNLRSPQIFREKEMEIRSYLAQKLERGKIDAVFTIESRTDSPSTIINKPLALQYYQQLKDLKEAIPEAGMDDILSVIVRMPDVFKSEKEEISDEEWQVILNGLAGAVEEADHFRQLEGTELEADFRQRVEKITALLKQVEPFESVRVTGLRSKLRANLEEISAEISYDANRLEQELIYYFEKLDITEEKIRLKKHIDYFLETLRDKDSPGKKLGFITQEMGREINTLGSKANDADIQKLVVQMKDELEKVKEQLANIL